MKRRLNTLWRNTYCLWKRIFDRWSSTIEIEVSCHIGRVAVDCSGCHKNRTPNSTAPLLGPASFVMEADCRPLQRSSKHTIVSCVE